MRMRVMLREGRRVVKRRRAILEFREPSLPRGGGRRGPTGRRVPPLPPPPAAPPRGGGRRGPTGRRVPPLPLRRPSRLRAQGQPHQPGDRDGQGGGGDHRGGAPRTLPPPPAP